MLKSRPHVCRYFFTRRRTLFSVLTFRPHVNGVLGYQRHIFRKSVCRVEFFKNAGLSLFFVDGRKRRFWNTMTSYIIQRMSCKRHYRISIVLAFSCSRAKTIRIRYVWSRILFLTRNKKFPFTKISGYVWTKP